jgi:adiponectin receptor
METELSISPVCCTTATSISHPSVREHSNNASRLQIKLPHKKVPANHIDLDPIKPDQSEIPDELRLQIEAARAKAASGMLLKNEDLPLPWRINPLVLSGYQFCGSMRQCLLNLFRLSNETFNIWSHLIGLACCLLEVLTTAGAARTEQHGANSFGAAFLVLAGTCLLCSVVWHTFNSISRPHTRVCCLSIDLTGVTILISGASILTEMVAFQQNLALRTTYVGLTTICSVVCITIGFHPTFQEPRFGWLRASTFTALGATGVLPAIHLAAVTKDPAWTFRLYQPMILNSVMPALIGAVVYSIHFPERFCPGRFDYIGSSHNLWHIAVLFVVVGGYRGIDEMSRMAHERSAMTMLSQYK